MFLTSWQFFLTLNNYFDDFQLGFRANHSTETALVKVVNEIRLNTEAGKASVLVLLDLSAAFDTVDHRILLEWLENWVGFSCAVLKWLASYLHDRSFYVTVGNCTSAPTSLPYGVPQGSILGPLLFNLYMLPLGQIIKNNHISFHSYADDTQIYLALSPMTMTPLNLFATALSKLITGCHIISSKDKVEIIIFGKKEEGYRIATILKKKRLNT